MMYMEDIAGDAGFDDDSADVLVEGDLANAGEYDTGPEQGFDLQSVLQEAADVLSMDEIGGFTRVDERPQRGIGLNAYYVVYFNSDDLLDWSLHGAPKAGTTVSAFEPSLAPEEEFYVMTMNDGTQVACFLLHVRT